MSHTCTTCGAVADEASALCNPEIVNLACDHCGEENVSVNHVCREKIDALKFSCGTCGKVSDTDADLCNPKEII